MPRPVPCWPAGRRAADALAVDPADPRFAARPDLVATLTATAHGYFRFVNAAFAAETCRLFADVAARCPRSTCTATPTSSSTR